MTCSNIMAFEMPPHCEKFEATKVRISVIKGSKEIKLLKMIQKQFEIQGISHNPEKYFQDKESGEFFHWEVDYLHRESGKSFKAHFNDLKVEDIF